MPYKSSTIPLPKKYDRRIKLSDKDIEDIRNLHFKGGVGVREISRRYPKVSRRTIQFKLYPERQKRNVELRNERGGSKQYYNKEKHSQAIKDHRRYKHKLYQDGKIT